MNEAHDFYFLLGERRAKTIAGLAKKFGGGDPGVAQALASMDGDIKATIKVRFEKIDAQTFPDAHKGVTNPDELAEVAMTWFRESEDWGSRQGNTRYKDQEPRQPKAVAITGSWRVTKYDAFKRPVQYGLPVLVAVELESEKPRDLARVYELTLVGPESANPKMEPPFVGAFVGDSHYIRPKAVRQP